MFTAIKYRIAGLAALLAGLALTGCVYDGAEECPGQEDREVVMSFRLVSWRADAASRATVVGEEEATAAENWVDPSDLRFLLLTEGGMLLRDITPAAFDPATDDYGTYTVRTVSFREPYFDYAAVNGRVRFRIMVLANWPDNALNALAGCRGLADIERVAATEPALYDLPEGFRPALPADGTGTGIPMYGLKSFDLTQEALFASTEQAPVELTSGDDAIHLLRSLAKLEVIDAIETRYGEELYGTGYPRIASVTLLSGKYRRDARLIPDGFADGEQVTAASLFATPNTAGADLAFAPRNYGALTPPVEQYPDGEPSFTVDWADCFTAYLPEMAIPAGDALRVVVRNYPEGTTPPDGHPATYEYTIPIPASTAWGTQLLRNHIYRLRVTGAGTDFNMEYTYTICPWNEASTEVGFD